MPMSDIIHLLGPDDRDYIRFVRPSNYLPIMRTHRFNSELANLDRVCVAEFHPLFSSDSFEVNAKSDRRLHVKHIYAIFREYLSHSRFINMADVVWMCKQSVLLDENMMSNLCLRDGMGQYFLRALLTDFEEDWQEFLKGRNE